jgi:hypothetical protein
MERDVSNLFNDYLRESLKSKMIEAVCKVNEALDNPKKRTREEWVELLLNANTAISNICMGDDALYSEHEYHFFEGASGSWVAQGTEIKTTNRYD